MRTLCLLALAVVAPGPTACSRPAASEPAPPLKDPSAPTTASARPAPESKELSRTEYDRRLFAAFEECERHRLPTLDGHWIVADSPKVRDVWMCEGHIRWNSEYGLLSDICFSKLSAVDGGVDAEGFFHEDYYDPGDASGVYVYLRQRGARLSVDVAYWEEPNNRIGFFVLERKSETAAQPGMKCPLE